MGKAIFATSIALSAQLQPELTKDMLSQEMRAVSRFSFLFFFVYFLRVLRCAFFDSQGYTFLNEDFIILVYTFTDQQVLVQDNGMYEILTLTLTHSRRARSSHLDKYSNLEEVSAQTHFQGRKQYVFRDRIEVGRCDFAKILLYFQWDPHCKITNCSAHGIAS